MRKSFKFLSVAAALVAGVAAANAASLTWTDVDLGGSDFRYLTANPGRGQSSSFESTFNILSDGYNPGTMYVQSAWVGFAFADDSLDGGEWVDISLDNVLAGNNIEVNGAIWSYHWLTGSLSGSLLASLQDGVLSYRVEVESGDTFLKEAKLVAKGDYRRVPDSGSTVALLGVGLLGLAALKRRRK